MSSREITIVALKVFALYVLLQFALGIPQTVNSFLYVQNSSVADVTFWWIWLVGVAVLIGIGLIGFLLWRFADAISETAQRTGSNEPSWQLESVVLSALGVFLVVQALIRLVHLSTSAYLQASVLEDPDNVSAETIAQIAAYVIQALIGMSLVRKVNGWIRLLRRFREAGLVKTSSNKSLNTDASDAGTG